MAVMAAPYDVSTLTEGPCGEMCQGCFHCILHLDFFFHASFSGDDSPSTPPDLDRRSASFDQNFVVYGSEPGLQQQQLAGHPDYHLGEQVDSAPLSNLGDMLWPQKSSWPTQQQDAANGAHMIPDAAVVPATPYNFERSVAQLSAPALPPQSQLQPPLAQASGDEFGAELSDSTFASVIESSTMPPYPLSGGPDYAMVEQRNKDDGVFISDSSGSPPSRPASSNSPRKRGSPKRDPRRLRYEDPCKLMGSQLTQLSKNNGLWKGGVRVPNGARRGRPALQNFLNANQAQLGLTLTDDGKRLKLCDSGRKIKAEDLPRLVNRGFRVIINVKSKDGPIAYLPERWVVGTPAPQRVLQVFTVRG